MSSTDSFAASGSSPTRKKKTAIRKWDFRVEFHGAIILLIPLTRSGRAWASKNIGADNGYQPYFPTVIIEPRYLDQILGGIRVRAAIGGWYAAANCRS
jgi:hypothetical protein